MRGTTVAWLAVAAILVAACTSAGTGPVSPAGTPSNSPAIVSPTLATANASGGTTVSQSPSSGPLSLSSPAFADGAAIPTRFSCDGQGISPEVDWSGAPAATVALALTVIDPDAHGFVHWLVYDIPAGSAGSLAEDIGTGPGAPPQGANGRGKAGYTGPCPPSGTHHYVFTLYALDQMLAVPAGATRADVAKAMDGHIVGSNILLGLFER